MQEKINEISQYNKISQKVFYHKENLSASFVFCGA